MSTVEEIRQSARRHINWTVNAGLLLPDMADDLVESITATTLLFEGGLITERLFHHLVGKIGTLAGERMLARGGPLVRGAGRG